MELVRENIAKGTRKLNPLSLRIPRLGWMRSSRRRAAAVVLSLGAWMCICTVQAQILQAGSPPAPFAGAIVSEWKGEVHVQIPGKGMARPVRGQALPAGTAIDTGDGQLLLVLRTDESEILVQPHTRLTLNDPAPGSWDAIEVVRPFNRNRSDPKKGWSRMRDVRAF